MSDHRIFPHGPPVELAPGLWQVEGSLPFPLKRNMTVYRRPDGEQRKNKAHFPTSRRTRKAHFPGYGLIPRR